MEPPSGQAGAMGTDLPLALDPGIASSPAQSSTPLHPEPDVMAVDTDVPDAQQRAAALRIQHSCIVEAPAGSGKTGLLIQRFLKLLAFGGVEQPDEILAITFTRKADAEMRHRVLAQLTSAHTRQSLPPQASTFDKATRQLAEAVLARDRALGWRLLDNPRQLNIRTIDSFCAELAGSTPLIAGASGRYNPTDDPSPLYQAAAERTLLQMGGQDPVLTRDLEDLLLHRDAQPGDFVRLLADMLRQREQWGELLPLSTERLSDEALDRDVRPRLTRTLQRLIGQELAATADLVGKDLLQRLASLAHTLSTCPGYNGEISPIALCERFPNAPGASAQDLEHWVCLSQLVVKADGGWRSGLNRKHLGLEADRTEQQQIRELIADFRLREQQRPGLSTALQQLSELPEPDYPEDQWRVVKALCRTLRQALVELQLVFAERHSCDFAEIALTSKGLMRLEHASADLLNSSVAGLRHLLVDEMQDTSSGQYELLESLTASWDGATQTVFLVGDPKQSIYEFRQARVERFRRVMEARRFGHLTLEPLRLTANFRSQASLVSDFNATFAQIFPAPGNPTLAADSVDVPFIEACATRSFGISPALVWHIADDAPAESQGATNGPEDETGDLAPTPSAQARAIRDTIERFLASWQSRPKSRAPKIAVLARNRAHLAPVIQEFHQDHGQGRLFFRAVDVEALAERPEILDLLALTRALLHPADRVAWLAVLRSPMCGLNLGDLLSLTGDGPEAEPKSTIPELIASRSSLLSPEAQAVLARTWPILDLAQRDLGRTGFSTHLERTWRSLGGDLPLQPHERANARRYLNLLQVWEQGPEALSLAALNRRLRNLYAEPSAPEAAVELMTIHKAKGLEWDLVLVPALHRGSGRNDAPFLKWLEFDTAEGSPELVLAPIQSKGEKRSSLSGWLNRRQEQREAAEAKRLFYVACTRAREELHLFGTVQRKQNGSCRSPRPDSLLAAAWPTVEHTLNARELRSEGTANVVPFSDQPVAAERFSLAASAASTEHDQPPDLLERPHLGRLPLAYDPLHRFALQHKSLLAYPAPETLRSGALFARPEGSFAARAFGNVVHRFLEFLSVRLAKGEGHSALREELPRWKERLQVTLRNEGLAPGQAAAESQRALAALQATLHDADGAWLLSPQTRARTEAALPSLGRAESSSLRADRTFFAGARAQSAEDANHMWIVDYKTAELGGRTRDQFLAEQKQKYTPQMNTYAEAAIRAGNQPDRLILALYFPLVPTLLYWPFPGVVPHQ